MNKIKSSFSKIKASEEFKDKLKMELLNDASQLRIKTNKNYSPLGLKAAAVLLILLGTASFKLIINNTYKHQNIDSGNTTYASKDELDKFTNDNSISSPVSNKNNNHAIDNNKSNVKAENSTGIKNSSSFHDNSPSTNNNYDNNNNSNNKVKYSKETTLGNTSTNENVASVSQNSDNDNNNNNNNLTPSNDINSSQYATTSNTTTNNSNKNEALTLNSTLRSFSSNTVYIPKFQIPDLQDRTKSVKMVPLIVYNGNVYLRAPILIDSKDILGRKIGTTTGELNNFNPMNTYSKNIISNIGTNDVYAVNGYDEDFRIMTNVTLSDGTNHPEIYECLNGITITTGNDFFGKFNLPGNIVNARVQTQTSSDSNNEKENFYTTSDPNFLNSFVQELDDSTPYLPENIENSLDDYTNNDKCKKIFLDLKDGSKNVPFTILRNGYIYYGEYPTIYFKISTNFINEIWGTPSIISAN